MRGECAPHVLRLPEPVTFALEGDVRVRDAALAASASTIDLRLRGRHDLVVQALQQQQRPRDRVGVVHRRTVAIEVDRLGPRPDEVLVVVGLELVRVLVERHQVGDAEVGRACR